MANNIEAISGLQYVENYISEDEEKLLIEAIDQEIWSTELSRRVQHYGYRYDYKKRYINSDMQVGGLPQWATDIATRLFEAKYVSAIPNQVIVNEYQPGQGIADHVDCEPCFGDTILSLSLGSACTMNFTHITSGQKVGVYVLPRSLVVMRGEARYQWKHGIPARKSDVFDDTRYPRFRRISITFRVAIVENH